MRERNKLETERERGREGAREREGEKERKREGQRKRERERVGDIKYFACPTLYGVFCICPTFSLEIDCFLNVD